jgi:ABC-type spermidine/putrescine transport system permease subunit II
MARLRIDFVNWNMNEIFFLFFCSHYVSDMPYVVCSCREAYDSMELNCNIMLI